MKYQVENECILIKNLMNGDRSSFDRIYDLYAGRLYAFSLDFCKEKADAEDIVQDVFIRLWINRGSIRNTDSVKSLLFAMARNALISAWKAKTEMKFGHYSEADNIASADVSEQEYAELETMVNGFIDRLNPTQRDVVRMSRFENKCHREIAENLGLSVQTVKNAISQGLKSVRLSLGKHVFLILLFCGFVTLI